MYSSRTKAYAAPYAIAINTLRQKKAILLPVGMGNSLEKECDGKNQAHTYTAWFQSAERD
jgi:hypothetical protein